MGYERSFKMRPGQLPANRYLRGITTDQLSMSSVAGQSFWKLDPCANLILIGFEVSEPGCVYKLYLEFDEHFISVAGDDVASLTTRMTDYVLFPEYSSNQISKEIERKIENTSLAEHVLSIVHRNLALSNLALSNASELRFLEVRETEGLHQRQSFDLNVYAAESHVGSILGALERLAHLYMIPTSRNTSRTNTPFVTHLPSSKTLREPGDVSVSLP